MSAHVLNSSDLAKKPARYSTGEEIANAVTHGIAALMSIAGLAILVGFAVASWVLLLLIRARPP